MLPCLIMQHVWKAQVRGRSRSADALLTPDSSFQLVRVPASSAATAIFEAAYNFSLYRYYSCSDLSAYLQLRHWARLAESESDAWKFLALLRNCYSSKPPSTLPCLQWTRLHIFRLFRDVLKLAISVSGVAVASSLLGKAYKLRRYACCAEAGRMGRWRHGF